LFCHIGAYKGYQIFIGVANPNCKKYTYLTDYKMYQTAIKYTKWS
jgi:hypothetical protein